MFRLRPAYLAVLVLAACSPVADPSNVPDAAIDAPDTTPPMIVSSSPSNMEQRVSLLSPISVFFDRRLEPASVTDMTVRLRYSYGYGWTYAYGTVSYDDAARKVSFIPSLPMYSSYRYEVMVNGVKDLSGNTLTDGRVGFLTIVNYQRRNTNYDVSTGVITSAYDYQLDATGRLQKGLSISGSGTDGIWFTPDDVVACCPYSYVYSPEGKQLEYRYWNATGPDTKFGTNDDVLASLSKYTYDPAHGQASYQTSYGAGADTILGTPDDVVTGYNAYYYNADGIQIGTAYFSNPGTDGVWQTPDDKGSSWNEVVLDAKGNRIRSISRDNGPDQLPKTPDDLVTFVSDTEYDSYGYYNRYIYKDGPGPDNMWLTPDDKIYLVVRYARDGQGLVTDYYQYNAPGPDTMWLTSDDVMSYRQGYENGPTKQQTGYIGYAAGPDTLWNTPDDVINSYTKYTYAANGNRVDVKSFVSGTDGMFKTADDRVQYDGDFEQTK